MNRRLSARRRLALAVGAAVVAAVGLTTAPAVAAPGSDGPTRAEVAAARSSLEHAGRLPGTAWAVDEVTHQLVVTVFDNAGPATVARISAATAKWSGAVHVERERGSLTRRLAGGDAIYGGAYRCSLGFNVRSGTTYYFLTAGHCGNLATTWYTNSSHTTVAGSRTGTSFPGNDYAIVKYTGTVTHPGTVDLYNGTSQDITTAGNAYVGESVRRSGSTFAVAPGHVYPDVERVIAERERFVVVEKLEAARELALAAHSRDSG
jgi:hypothetical protein